LYGRSSMVYSLSGPCWLVPIIITHFTALEDCREVLQLSLIT